MERLLDQTLQLGGAITHVQIRLVDLFGEKLTLLPTLFLTFRPFCFVFFDLDKVTGEKFFAGSFTSTPGVNDEVITIYEIFDDDGQGHDGANE